MMTGNHPKRWGRVSSPHRPVQSLCVVTTGQFVGSSDVSGKYGDGKFTGTVHANHGRVGIFVLHARSDGADTDSHGANEDKGIIAVEVFRCEFAGGFYMCASLFVPEGEDFGVGKFVE